LREKKNLKKLSKENKMKIDFHGNRDFFNLIKGVARELRKLGKENDIINRNTEVYFIKKSIEYKERNFGGMEIEIDIDEKYIEE